MCACLTLVDFTERCLQRSVCSFCNLCHVANYCVLRRKLHHFCNLSPKFSRYTIYKLFRIKRRLFCNLSAKFSRYIIYKLFRIKRHRFCQSSAKFSHYILCKLFRIVNCITFVNLHRNFHATQFINFFASQTATLLSISLRNFHHT